MDENKYYPGRDNYIGPDSGLAGYVHHDTQWEYCWSFKERIEAIRTTKPVNEIATRLHCLVYLDPTGQPWDQARVALDQARKALAQYAPQIESQIRALLPDAPWDGTELVFPNG